MKGEGGRWNIKKSLYNPIFSMVYQNLTNSRIALFFITLSFKTPQRALFLYKHQSPVISSASTEIYATGGTGIGAW